MRAQAVHLACIVFEQFMPPSHRRFLVAILRHRMSDFLIGLFELRSETFGFGQDAENKNPVFQTVGNSGLRLVQSALAAIEIDQQNHASLGIRSHRVDVIRL